LAGPVKALFSLLPTIHENDPEVIGASVTNVGISPVFSQVDLNTLALTK
jgi:hypothetical protein